jgi:ribonuclease P protein subunit RPR2
MEILYQLAKESIREDTDLAKRYIHLLRRISQRTRTKIPPEIKNSICKKCNIPLISGFNSHTRIRQTREPHIATTCHVCGDIQRRPIKRKTP